ncbi:MAG: pseudouridine-5'-phosphate glycosidase [Phycisphaerales bacterium]
MRVIARLGPRPVALETTLLVHGVPREAARPLAAELNQIIRDAGANPALVGVVDGRPTVGMTDDELDTLLAAPSVPKANTANLGAMMHAGSHAATTVSATMELAAAAGVRVFATGGIGGVHPGYGTHLDISSDLAALARFPVAVVASGVKSILDVESTREALETLGVPVIGYRTDRFPAFYRRESDTGVDWRFDDAGDLATYVTSELARTGRGVLVANPIPPEHEIAAHDWTAWLAQAEREVGEASQGRDRTPALLARLHNLSGGRTLASNLALVRANAALAAALASAQA